MADDEKNDPARGPGLGFLMGRLLDRSRVEMEKAARRGRELLQLRQLRADRDRMYQKIGKEARALLEAGELDHPGIRRGVERVAELELKIQAAEDQLRGYGQEPEPDPSAEPAEPTDTSR